MHDEPRVTVLVPVKWTGRGKSRLDVPVDRRRALALAMAQDTVAAAAAAEGVLEVVVVTEDDQDAQDLQLHDRVRTVRATVDGLNPSLRQALAALPPGTGAVAVLPADLPALRPQDLADALRSAVGTGFAVVGDRDGIGSTLLYADRVLGLVPDYGGASLARHRAAGAVELPIPTESTLRHDVDLIVHLTTTHGPRTRAVLAG